MHSLEFPAKTASQALRVIRALGAHRYVAGRLHLIHAFVFDAIPDGFADGALTEARAWARATLTDPDIEQDSRDERLHRRSTDRELALAISAFWEDSPVRAEACAALLANLEAVGAVGADSAPFDESCEDDVYPVLIDGGWELLPLSSLERERHKGVLESYEPLALDVARFEEESAIPPRIYLFELPLFGAAELLSAVDEWGDLAEPLVVWSSCEPAYEAYLYKGILRASRLEDEG